MDAVFKHYANKVVKLKETLKLSLKEKNDRLKCLIYDMIKKHR